MPATLVTRRPPRPIRVEDSGRWASTALNPVRKLIELSGGAATRCYLDG